MTPDFVDLWPNQEFVRDQKSDNACTGYDGAEHMGTFYDRAGRPARFSAKFLWWQERALTGTADNVGVSPAMIAKVLETMGVCLESTMPDGTPFSTPPTAEAVAEALSYRIESSTVYSRLETWDATLERIMATIAKDSTVSAIMFVQNDLFNLTGPWRSHSWNLLNSPLNPLAGLHAFELGGFDRATTVRRLLAKNSWGPGWADGGFFGIPFDYVTDAGKSPFLLFIELVPLGVPIINAGWRPDLTAQQTIMQQAYVAYFGRPADLGGLNFWANVAASNPLTFILNQFAASQESHALYTGQTTAQVIDQVYRQLFGRAAEPSGLAFWAHAVDSGSVTIGEVIFAILQGAQGTDLDAVRAKVEASNVLTFTNPNPDPATSRAWLAPIITAIQVQPAVEALP